MRTEILLPLFSLLPLIPLTTALPVATQQRAIQPRAKYSVVAVDGGSDGTSSPSSPADEAQPATTVISTVKHTETITPSATTPPPSTKTLVSTETIDEDTPEKTSVVVLTKDVSDSLKPTSKAKVQTVNAEQDMNSLTITHTAIETLTATVTASCSTSPGAMSALSKSSSSTSSTFAKPFLSSSPAPSSPTSSTASTPTSSITPSDITETSTSRTSSAISSESSTPTSSSSLSPFFRETTKLHPTASKLPSAAPYWQAKQKWHAAPLVPVRDSANADWNLKSYDNGMWVTSAPAPSTMTGSQ